MEKSKFRFSYFIIVGLIGFLIQLSAFFSFTKVNISASNLIATKDPSYFQAYTNNHIIFLAGTVLVIAMLVAYLFGKKKHQTSFNLITTLTLLCQIGLFVVVTYYLVYAGINRVKMFSSKDPYIKVITNLVLLRDYLLLASFAFYSLFSIGLLYAKENTLGAKICIFFSSSVNIIAFVLLLTTICMKDSSSAFSMLNNLYEVRLLPPYKYIYPTMNGFTYGQLTRLTYVFGEVESRTGVKNFQYSAMNQANVGEIRIRNNRM